MKSNRFVEITKDFFIGLQSNFEIGESVEKFLKIGVDSAELFINEKKGQVFHLAESVGDGKEKEIIFSIVTNGGEKWKKLVFFSKARAAAARFGETEPFGFDETRPGPGYRGHGYILLALPGITGKFEPVYFKVQSKRSHPIFFQVSVDASGEEEIIIVRARVVSSHHCPHHLYFK